MNRIERAEAAVEAARAWLADAESLALTSDAEIVELLARTAELARVVEALQLRVAAEVAERSSGPADTALCRKLGHRSAKDCLSTAFGIRSRQAADLLALAAATSTSTGLSCADVPAPFPLVAAALADAELSAAQAHAIVQALEPAAPRADPADLAWAERSLVEAATAPHAPLVPELIAVQGRAYAAVLDPDGVLPDAERQRAMRSLRIGRRSDGLWQLTMVCPPEQGAAIKAVLDAHTGPRVPVRFHDPDASTRAESGADVAQSVGDDRTPAQLRHDVLVGILQAHAASGGAPAVGGEAPTLVITGTIEALRAGLDGVEHRERFARIEHTGDLMPIEHAARLLCDAAVQVAITNGGGHVLDLGRAQRLFTRAQRRALAARDQGCRAPGCSMPPSWCEAHHVRPWLEGGPTDLANGILLCAHHHHEVHAGRLRIERAGPVTGQWRVVAQLQPLRRRARPVPVAACGADERPAAVRLLSSPSPGSASVRSGSRARRSASDREKSVARRMRARLPLRSSRGSVALAADRASPRIVLRL